MNKIEKINIQNKFDKITDFWNPRIVGELNGQQIRLAKFKGEFIYHKHDDEDEMFLVYQGKIRIDFQTHEIELNQGEFIVIPKGQIHRPIADEEAAVMLFVKDSNINTGDIQNDMTKRKLDHI
jgi:mannose-6-phosphate isomerase-like protein (cupin superfamily)